MHMHNYAYVRSQSGKRFVSGMPQATITGKGEPDGLGASDAGGFRLTLPHQRNSSLSLAY
jgi:hypothetical protein